LPSEYVFYFWGKDVHHIFNLTLVAFRIPLSFPISKSVTIAVNKMIGDDNSIFLLTFRTSDKSTAQECLYEVI